MSEIICPVCGTANADTLEICQHCGNALKQGPKGNPAGPISGTPPTDPLAALLAGLGQQAEPEGEIPDWLKNLQSSIPAAPPVELPAEPEPSRSQEEAPQEASTPADQAGFGSGSGVFHFDDNFEAEAHQPSENPDWLNALKAQDDRSNTAQNEPAKDQPATGDFSDWLAGISGPTPEKPPDQGEQLSPDNSKAPDWLSGLGGDFNSEESSAAEILDTAPSGNVPDWLAALENPEAPQAAPADVPTAENLTPALPADMPDWLSALQGPVQSQPAAEEPPAHETPSPAPSGDIPDWLAALQGPAQPQPAAGELPAHETPSPAPSGDIPDWLAALQGPAQPQPAAEELPAHETPSPAPSGDSPDWLAALQNPEQPQPAAEELPAPEAPKPAPSADLPDWLAFLNQPTPTPSIPAEPVKATRAEEELASMARPAESQQESVTGMSEETTFSSPSPLSAEQKVVEPNMEPEGEATAESLPETPSEVEALIPGPAEEPNIDSILSMETPGWLAGLTASEPAEKEAVPSTESPAQANLPEAELPSWVQAMRPLESVIEGTHDEEDDQEVEAQGPLAGLHSILPIQPGLMERHKPGAYSIKLQANETQQAQAELLENLLSSENQPREVAKDFEKVINRPLRWLIAALLLLGVLVTAAVRPAIFPAPAQPTESSPVGMFRKTLSALPDGAPVLVVLDYQAGFAGELEAATAPVMEHLMSKGARLAFISTTPLGGLMADRLLQKFANMYPYQAGTQYVNLGYLPGGANGIKAFADRPASIIGQDSLSGDLWNSPALADVTAISEPRLSNFAAVIVATDNADTGRLWIEQAQPALESTPMLMVVSAQAEPMIYPYLLSNQLRGLVSGLEGGLLYESAQGKPGEARSYWDAFGIAVLVAELIILFGGAWSLFSSLRARRTSIEQDEA